MASCWQEGKKSVKINKIAEIFNRIPLKNPNAGDIL